MNILKSEKQGMIIGGLVEGSSIRSIERMSGVHRDTIMRLLVRVGDTCEEIMDSAMTPVPMVARVRPASGDMLAASVSQATMRPTVRAEGQT